MTLFKTIKTANTLATLSSKNAKIIYGKLKTKDGNRLFLEDDIATEYTEQVQKEISSLESEMVSKMSGSYVLTPKVLATYDDEGEVLTKEVPAVYYIVTTEAALKASMSSDLLDVSTVVTDVRIWSDGKPDESPSWDTYKSSFTSE